MKISDKINYNGKTYTLGFNQITSLNKYLKNNIKKEFFNLYKNQIQNLDLKNITTINYKLTSNNKRRFDLMNIISIIDKFLLDLLVENGILIDDNVNIITSYTISYVGIDTNLSSRIIEVSFS